MIFRRRKRRLDLTAGAYDRWLRAQRPPFEWFLGLPVEEQEALAQLGDTHSTRLILQIGHTILDPDAALDGALAAEGDPEGEARLARRAAERTAARIGAEPAMPVRPRGPTMAGIGARKIVGPGPTKVARMLFGQEATAR